MCSIREFRPAFISIMHIFLCPLRRMNKVLFFKSQDKELPPSIDSLVCVDRVLFSSLLSSIMKMDSQIMHSIIAVTQTICVNAYLFGAQNVTRIRPRVPSSYTSRAFMSDPLNLFLQCRLSPLKLSLHITMVSCSRMGQGSSTESLVMQYRSTCMII